LIRGELGISAKKIGGFPEVGFQLADIDHRIPFRRATQSAARSRGVV
jgi:hypothetical protein